MDTRTFYDRISAVYDRLANAGERACRDQGVAALQVSSGERVLEIGVGTGHALTLLALAVGETGHVCGVDLSPGMMAVARRTVAAAGAVRVSLAINDARSLCFREAAFDAVFMSFVLDLFETVDIPVVLAEIERVLRPAGRLVVVGMAESVSSGTMTDVYQWLHRHFPLVVDCRPIDVVGVLERAGFHVTRTQAMSICGLAVASTVARKSVMVGGLPR